MTRDTRNADIYPPRADRTFYETVKKTNQKKTPVSRLILRFVASGGARGNALRSNKPARLPPRRVDAYKGENASPTD